MTTTHYSIEIISSRSVSVSLPRAELEKYVEPPSEGMTDEAYRQWIESDAEVTELLEELDDRRLLLKFGLLDDTVDRVEVRMWGE